MTKTAAPALPVLDKLELLRRSPYFAGLLETELGQVEAQVAEERYPREAIIFSEGDDNRKLYLVASGAVKIFGTSADGKEQIIGLARPGDSFNDVTAFDRAATQATAQALTPVIVYLLSGQALLDESCRLGPLAANIIRALAAQVRQLGALVADLSFRPVAGRLAKILLEQVDNTNGPYLTQRDMAAMVGTAREVVARGLKAMEEQGLIRLERHRITILNRPALEEMRS